MPVNIKELIDNGYIVICDTNVYLHIYRFSPEFSDFALRCMQAIQSGIIMPSTVRYEFLKHYRGYFSKMEKRVQNVGDDTKKQISNAARKVLNLCDNLQSLQYPDIEELRADLSQKFDELMAIPEAFFEDRTILDLIANPWKGQDPVYNLVELIINDSRVMTSVTQEEIYQICEEGERRYKTDPQTPPGFKDAKNKDGVRKYSDLIMWKEILRYAREKSVNVIFVTDDVKSDWWIDDNGQREFHPYLCQEFQRETQMQIVALTALDFFSNISVTYGIPKSDAVQAYEVCGWNLETSENEYNKNLFPTFQDLLTELVDVIEHSAYDKEVKNNYRGSLETRVRSLANGLNGQIFSADEIPEKQLFDENTIVDLSRVGSLESKSLIMGILIMRLNEYRMTSCTEMNNPLKHVTVLEEAHNILRRTSMEQTEEGSNVAGKSVEMIANAIAEMRTYGEGFVIADQSPGAVDISAIRNTNTKIIMRLPDEQDRQLAGKAAALKDDQLDEIARLPKGVAVIYQNNWTEPVLCKINKFEGEEKRYQYKTCATDRKAEMMSAILLRNLLKKEKGEPLDLNLRQLQDLLLKVSMPSKTKIAALKALQKNGRCRQKDIQSVVYKLVCTPKVEEELTHTESIEEWRDEIAYFGSTELADLDEEMLNEVAELILLEQIKRYDWPKTYLEQWQEFRKKEMLV